jgi:hypothetical protein
MMADLIAKLRRSTDTSPIFGDRVTGVADASRAIEYTALGFPAAYVTFLADDAEEQRPGSNDNRQRITEQWGVIVGLQATADVRGHQPAQSIMTVRRALFRAIYNWRPPASSYGALWYVGCKLLEVNRAATFWLFTFASHCWVDGECDGEHEEQFDPLPDFLGANIKVDWLQPFDPGIPPSQEYDPRYPPPRTYGPDGRIETTFTVDVEQPP